MSNASPLDFMQNVGLTQQRETPNIVKPWMKYHRFEVVSTIEKLEWVIQKAFEAKECSLDLETQGLDTRVYLKPVSELESPHEIWWDPASPPALVPQSVHKIVGYCLSYDGITGYYVPVRHTAPGAVNVDLVRAGQLISKLCHAAQPELTTEGLAQDPLGSYLIKTPGKIKLYFWHAKFDQELLYPVTGIDFWHPESYEDGMLLYFVKYTSDKNLDLKQKSFKELFVRDAQGKLITENNNAIPYEMIKLKELFLKGREIDFPSLHPEEPGVVAYACSDAICTFLHCKKPELISMTRDPKYFPMYRLEKQSAQALRGMERNRVKLDLPYVRSLFAEARIEADGYRNQIVTLASEYGFPDFDPQSPAQLAEFLFKSPSGLKIEPKPEQTPSGQYKTDADTLEKIVLENSGVNPILLVVVKYRQVEKVIGTYLEAMVANCDANDEARVQFKQTGAATGRISAPGGDPKHGYCGFPPHGIPSTYDEKKPKVATCLRQAFIARPGYTMVKVDFAGEELRIVTNLSQEPVWIKEFLEGTGDLHTITAKAFFNKEDITKQERQQGKIANFSLVYGGGVRAIMNATGCNQPEAGRRKLNFDKSMPRFAGWVTLQKKYIHEHKGVKTAFGRWIATPQVDSEDKALVGAAERWSINYPIQGCQNFNSRVMTTQGFKRIGDLEGSGEAFTAWTGSVWATAKAFNMGQCQLSNIRLADGATVTCDTRHKLLVVTEEGYNWVDYPELKPKDKVATSLCFPVEFSPEPLAGITPQKLSRLAVTPDSDLQDFWYWMGRYYGDGNVYLTHNPGITYSFGDHEGEAIARCVAFWKLWGLNPKVKTGTHQPDQKISTRHQVVVYSKDLAFWLKSIGIEPATAHTKKLTPRILQETLVNRKAFMRGFMDSDGCRPTVEKNKGNPYSLHLCQRELLADTKLLLRTLGVESCVRGPYQYVNKKTGLETTSYRLDIQRRMFERNVMDRTDLRYEKFHDMEAPKFLVVNFLSKGTWKRSDFKGDQSLYTLYSRIRTGGKVGVYTLDRLCRTLGVRLDHPIYGFKRLVSKTELDRVEDTYTLSVNDPLHRFEADGVISKNSGADIMKMAMVLLHKEFYRLGWYAQDAIRMLLTVHDEIVFEVKHHLVPEAMPIIEELMTRPGRMARWQVPLEVEPLIDSTWDAKYDYHKILHGSFKPPKEGEKLKGLDLRVGNYIFHKVPAWLEGIVIPDWQREGWDPSAKQQKSLGAPIAGIVTPPTVQAPSPVQAQAQVTAPSALPPVANPTTAVAEPETPLTEDDIFVYPIYTLTEFTMRKVAAICIELLDDGDCKVLHLVSVKEPGQYVLIDASLGIRVNPESFGRLMRDRGL